MTQNGNGLDELRRELERVHRAITRIAEYRQDLPLQDRLAELRTRLAKASEALREIPVQQGDGDQALALVDMYDDLIRRLGQIRPCKPVGRTAESGDAAPTAK